MSTPDLVDVPDYHGYAVTADGRVFSRKSGKFLRPSLSHGYPMVNLTLGSLPKGRRGQNTGRQAKQRTVRIHRLMHHAFFPGADGVINHKDGVKANNALANLEVVSSSVNNLHAYATGLRVPTQLSSERARAMRQAQQESGARSA